MFKKALHRLALFLLSLNDEDTTRKRVPLRKTHNFDHQARGLIEASRSTGAKITAGSIQLVGLDEAKEALGRNWAKVAERAADIAERVIQKYLAPEDVCTKATDDTFLICFAHFGKAKATATARRISQEIKSALEQEVPTVADRITVDDFVEDIADDYLVSDERPLAEVLLGSLTRMRAEAEYTMRQRRASLVRDARVLFRPIWHPNKGAIQLYRCVLDANSGGAAMEHFKAISVSDELQVAIAELDYLVVARVLDSLHMLLQRQSQALFLVPIHFWTLANKATRENYLKLLRGAPPAYAKFIICEICSVPTGTPTVRLRELVAALKACCRTVVVEIQNHRQVSEFTEASVWGMSIELGEPDSVENSEGFKQHLKRTVTIAKSQRVSMIAHGANSIGQLLSAIDIGFDLIDGEAVHRSLEEPKGAFGYMPPSTASVLRR